QRPGAERHQPSRQCTGREHRARPHRVPPAALLHEPSRARLQPRPAAGSRLGRQRLRRGTHRGRAHPPPAQGAGTVGLRRLRADGTRRGLSLFPATGPPVSPAWRRELLSFVLLLAGAGLAGWPFDLALPFMLLAAIAYGAWLLYWLYRLERWLTSERRPHPPEARGLWGEGFDALYRFQRRSRQRKLRVARLSPALRNSTAAAMPDGVVALNRDWRIVWFNDAAARLLGLSRQQDGGQHIGNLVRHPAFIEYIEQGLFQGVVEVESPLDDDRRLALSVVAYGQGERLLLVRDITRLHRLEQMR